MASFCMYALGFGLLCGPVFALFCFSYKKMLEQQANPLVLRLVGRTNTRRLMRCMNRLAKNPQVHTRLIREARDRVKHRHPQRLAELGFGWAGWLKNPHRGTRADTPLHVEPRIVALVGPSTFNYWHGMARDLAPQPVVNCGFGGARTFELLEMAAELVLPLNPRIVVLYAGVNDVFHGFSMQSARRDLGSLLDLCVAQNPNLGVVYVNVIYTEFARWLGPETLEKMRAWNGAVAEVLREKQGSNAGFDFRIVDTSDEPFFLFKRAYLSDGHHLTAEGHAQLATLICPKISELSKTVL